MTSSRFKNICIAVFPALFLLFGVGIGMTYGQARVITEKEYVEVPKYIEVQSEPEVEEPTSLGEFKITYYCPCYACSEGYGNSTATGVKAQANHTVAADPNIIPYGTEIVIDGQVYVVEDTGGALKGKRIIDIYVDDHSDIPDYGTFKTEVFLND